MTKKKKNVFKISYDDFEEIQEPKGLYDNPNWWEEVPWGCDPEDYDEDYDPNEGE